MDYPHLFGPSRFEHRAHRMVAWRQGERLRQRIREGHGRVSAILWNFTPFDGDRPFDDEIRGILAMEEALGEVPRWAVEVAVQIDALPHCGHASFPDPIYAICRGIGRECAEPRFMFCFEASSDTKGQVLRRIEALEAWLAGRTEDPALGPRTELKEALVEHLALTLRLWTVELVTNDGGQLTIPLNTGKEKAQVEASRARVKEIAARTGFGADRFFQEFDHPWLCHQRLSEQIEVALLRIGREQSQYDWRQARREAQPAADWMRRVYDLVIDAVTRWLDETAPALPDAAAAAVVANTYDVLGERTPVKVWLATAFRKKLTLFRAGGFGEPLAI